MNIYLDIDGVLLVKGGTLANHFDEFVEFFVENHNVFWLTTHCHGGENRAIEHITQKNVVSEKSLALLRGIKPTEWNVWKTDGIDFSQNFIWLDDYVFDGEKNILTEQKCLNSFIEINLGEKPEQLFAVMMHFRNYSHAPYVCDES
jgi:hypothetical protein